MFKKLLYPSLLLIPAIIIGAYFSWRVQFIEGPIRAALHNLTGRNVTFTRVVYRPFTQISIENLNIDGIISAPIVTFYINPLKLVKTHNIPYSIRKVILYTPDINLSGASSSALPFNTYTASGTKSLKTPTDLVLIWNNGKISLNDVSLSACSGRAIINDVVNARINGKMLGGKIDCEVISANRKGEQVVNIVGGYNGLGLDVGVKIFGKLKDSGSIEAYCEIPKIRAGNYSLNDSSGNFTFDNRAVSGRLYTKTGVLMFDGSDFNHFTSSGSFKLKNISGIGSGIVDVHTYKNDDEFSGHIYVSSVSAGSFMLDSANVYLKSDPSGAWSLKGKLMPSKYTIEGLLTKDLNLTVAIKSINNGSANISGSLAPLSIKVSVNNWGLSGTPFIESFYPGITGRPFN